MLLQGIVQLGILFMQMAPIALSLAIVDLMVAAIRCGRASTSPLGSSHTAQDPLAQMRQHFFGWRTLSARLPYNVGHQAGRSALSSLSHRHDKHAAAESV